MDELIRFMPGGIKWFAEDGSSGECDFLSDAIKCVERGRRPPIIVPGDVIPFEGDIARHDNGC